jgi:hypothetical protein
LDERDPARCSEGAHLANGARTITTSWNGVVVGRIFCLDAVGPRGRPWMWASGHNGDIKRAAHGYEATREAAMTAFAKSWRSEL